MRSSVPLHCCALGFESFSLQSASLCFQVVLRIFPEIMRLRLTVSPVGSGHVCQWQTSMTDRSEAKTGSERAPPGRLPPCPSSISSSGFPKQGGRTDPFPPIGENAPALHLLSKGVILLGLLQRRVFRPAKPLGSERKYPLPAKPGKPAEKSLLFLLCF